MRQAVEILRALTGDYPASNIYLATALNHLGNLYSELGQHIDALAATNEAVDIYRSDAVDNSASMAHLATALNNLGNRYSQLGRHIDALPHAGEAVAILRRLGPDNPTFRTDLATALNNLSDRYGELGRIADARRPAEEAAAIHLALAVDNPAFLPHLAGALNNRSKHCRQFGGTSLSDALWEQAIAGQTGHGRTVLLYFRAAGSEAGDRQAVPWLIEASRSADRQLVSAAHDHARRHRAVDPAAWDAAWSAIAGESPPVWLKANTALIITAETWLAAATYYEQRDYLAAHPELLSVDGAAALNEAIMTIAEPAGSRYREILDAARAHGVDAAYKPFFKMLLAVRFVAAPPATQRVLLGEHRTSLLDDQVRQHLVVMRAEDSNSRPHIDRALALLDLAHSNDPTLLDALDALDEPTRFPALLADTLPDRSSSVAPLATLALSVANTRAEAATAAVYLAIAAAVAGDTADAADTIRMARKWDADSTQTWIVLLAGLGATHPAVLSLIPVLLEPPDHDPAEDDAAEEQR